MNEPQNLEELEAWSRSKIGEPNGMEIQYQFNVYLINIIKKMMEDKK